MSRILLDDGRYISDPSDKTTVFIVSIVFCSLSVVMSLLILIFYGLYSSFRKNFASQLIVTISLMDFLTWGSHIIASVYSLTHDLMTYEEKSHQVCVVHGFLFTFMNLVVFFAVLIIGFSLFSEILYSYDISKRRHEIFAFIYIISFLLAAIPLITNSYGKVDDIKCWIVSYQERLVIFYMPLWFITIADIFFIICVIRKLSGMNLQAKMKKKLMIKFGLFPVLMFVSWAPSSVTRLYGYSNINLLVIIYAMMPLQGVFNPLAYGLINAEVKEKILDFLLCRWEKLKRKKTKENEAKMAQNDISQITTDSEINPDLNAVN